MELKKYRIPLICSNCGTKSCSNEFDIGTYIFQYDIDKEQCMNCQCKKTLIRDFRKE